MDLISSLQQESQTAPEPKVIIIYLLFFFKIIERKRRMALVRL